MLINKLRNKNVRHYPFIVGMVSSVFLFISIGAYFYLFKIVSESSREQILEVLLNEKLYKLIFRSVALGVIVTLISSTLGCVFAILVVRSDLWFKRTWNVLITISMAVPSYVLAYSWVTIFPDFASFSGAIFVLALIVTPYSYFNIKSALWNLDTSLEDVAKSLGRSNLNTIFSVVIPQLRKPILSGMLIGMLYVITDFGAVGTLRVEVFTWVIYGSYRSGFSPERSGILAILILVIGTLIVMSESLLGKKQKRNDIAKVSYSTKSIKLGKYNIAFQGLLAIYFSSLMLVPVIQSLVWLKQYRSKVILSELVKPFTNTLLIALTVVVISIIFSFSVALFASSSKMGSIAERIIMTLHGIPGIVTALAMVYVGTRIFPSIYLEWPLVVIALCIAFTYLAIGPIRNSITQQPIGYIENSYSLGRGTLSTVKNITIPLSKRGIKAGSILIFLGVVKELPITLLLRPNGENTLSTSMWSELSTSKYASVAPTILLLIFICVVPLLFLVKEK